MIRAEIIKQAEEAYKRFIETDGKENEEIIFGAMMRYDNPLSYAFKFINEFETTLILICRCGGGEATCYSLEYGIEEIKYAFDQFDELFDMEYVWCSYNGYEIGQDTKGIYVGKFGYGCNDDDKECDEYEECYILKRFDICSDDDFNKTKEYIDELRKDV